MVQKVRTKAKQVRALYDYRSLSFCEHLHYDTKILADSTSLPEDIYDNLKTNTHLPLYEWNIMDMATRMRFIGYSR